MSYIERIAQSCRTQELAREELAYYARHILLPGIGLEGQRKLKTARVLVVGAGGLGCPALQALVGAGVGRLTIVDADTVNASNLARQWLHRYDQCGSNKAHSAATALRQMNPHIEVSARATMLAEDNAHALIGAHDIVLDATDDLNVRYCIDKACAELDKPWIHAALYRESAQLTVFWAAYGSSFRQLYPEPSAAPSCSGAGMLGASSSVVGNLQALECIKLIVGQSDPALGQVGVFDSRRLSWQFFRLPDVTLPPRWGPPPEKSHGSSVSAEQLQQAISVGEPIELLDIRDGAAHHTGSLEGARHYPAERILEAGLPESGEPMQLLICEEGLISAMLVDALAGRASAKLAYLRGGLHGWRHLVG
jgi:adenylyltransferase/sulfurtransferase